MHESAHPSAADLLVPGTFALRRAFDRIAPPVPRTAPATAPLPEQGERQECPAEGIKVDRP